MCFALTAADARAAAAARCKSASLNSLRFSSESGSFPLTGPAMPFSVAFTSPPLLFSTLCAFDAFSMLRGAVAAEAAVLFSVGGLEEEEEESFGLFSSVAGLSSSLSLSLFFGSKRKSYEKILNQN